MYVLRPDLTEEQVEQEIERYRELLSERGAQEIQIQNLRRRRLAYEIQKHQDGIYIQVNYVGDGSQIAPLERAMRLSDEVLRYLTIKLKDPETTAEPEAEPVSAES